MEIMKSFWNGFKSMFAYLSIVAGVITLVYSVLMGVLEVIIDHTSWLDHT